MPLRDLWEGITSKNMITKKELIDFVAEIANDDLDRVSPRIKYKASELLKSIKSSIVKPEDCLIHTVDLNGICFKCGKQIFKKDDKGNLYKL